MATAVLHIDLQKPLQLLEQLERYRKAYIIFYWNEVPIGELTVPVSEGRIDLQYHFDAILKATGSRLKKAMALKKIGLEEHEPSFGNATVAICTRERPEDLERCLNALVQLENRPAEIIVIDNAPVTGSTKELVDSYPDVRYVLEPRKGLNHARNTALQEARYDIVAFTDDDAVPQKGWLKNLLRHFDHPLVAVCCGATFPLELETEGQEAFENFSSFHKGFEVKLFKGSEWTGLSAGHIGAGANMAIRRSVLDQTGYFDPALDAGTATQSGGDHEFFVRTLLRGFNIVYEPGAVSLHRHRRSYDETKKAIRGYGVGIYAYWTRLLLREGEWGVLLSAYRWLVHYQLKRIWSAIFRKNKVEKELAIEELKGCLSGPSAYLKQRRMEGSYE